MSADNFSLLDNQDRFGNPYYPATDNATIIEKEMWDELLRAQLGSVDSINDTNSPYTLTRTQSALLCDTTNGAITVNLPAASDLVQMRFVIRKIAGPPTNVITITPNGADTINGSSTLTINFTGSAASIFSDGASGWFTE